MFLWPPEHTAGVDLSWEWMCWVRPLLLIAIRGKITGIQPQRDTISPTVKTNWYSGELWCLLLATLCGGDDIIKLSMASPHTFMSDIAWFKTCTSHADIRHTNRNPHVQIQKQSILVMFPVDFMGCSLLVFIKPQGTVNSILYWMVRHTDIMLPLSPTTIICSHCFAICERAKETCYFSGPSTIWQYNIQCDFDGVFTRHVKRNAEVLPPCCGLFGLTPFFQLFVRTNQPHSGMALRGGFGQPLVIP